MSFDNASFYMVLCDGCIGLVFGRPSKFLRKKTVTNKCDLRLAGGIGNKTCQVLFLLILKMRCVHSYVRFRFTLQYLGHCFTLSKFNFKVIISALRLSEYELLVKMVKK